MSFLKKYLVVAVILDVIWAALLATFGASLVTSFGGVPAESLTTGSGWLMLFVAGLLQGAVFIVVLSVFAAITLFIYSKSPPAIQKIMKLALLADVVWAALVATFGAGVLDHVGGAAGVDSAFSSALLWFIAFVAGYIQGLIFMWVFGVFALIVMFFIAMSKKNSGPIANNRNPGEPPHR